MLTKIIYCICRVLLCILLSISFIGTTHGGEKAVGDRRLEKRRIAVFDFVANNVPASYSRIVRNIVESNLYATGDYNLLEREHIEKILKERKTGNIKIGDTSGMASLGKALSADYIIVGSIDRLNQFNLTIRVVSSNDGKILISHTRSFDSEKDMDAVAAKLCRRISVDLNKFVKSGSITPAFYDFYNLFVNPRFNYLYPVGRLHNIINAGAGATLVIGIENVYIDNLNPGIELGYYSFSGRRNSSDRCTFIPLLFNAGYRINITRKFYMTPSISAGINFLTLRHGSGYGFSMEENTESTSTNAMTRLGVYLGFIPVNSLHIQIGADNGIIHEKEGRLLFFNMSLGMLFIF